MSICLSLCLLLTQSWQRASVDSNGLQANGQSTAPALSSDGRYVAFWSYATNLVPGDTNGTRDVFVRDLLLGTTERVCENCDMPSIASGGRIIAYVSRTDLTAYVLDRVSGVAQSLGHYSDGPTLSDDGRFVAFAFPASVYFNIYHLDRQTGILTQATHGTGSSISARISRNGRFIGFQSFAPDLVQHDTNNDWDAFVYDVLTKAVDRVDVSTLGVQSALGSSGAQVTSDGRYAIFHSGDSDLVAGDVNNAADVFIRDRVNGTTSMPWPVAHQGNGYSSAGIISENGRFVVFSSNATNFDPAAPPAGESVFLTDRALGTTRCLSPAASGTCFSGFQSMTPDGSRVAFSSAIRTLVPNDTNGTWDVFLWAP